MKTKLRSFARICAIPTLFALSSARAQTVVQEWVQYYGGGKPTAIAVDTNGDVVVTGDSWNGMNNDYATIKYSNAGVALWTNRYELMQIDSSPAITVDISGRVFVTGTSRVCPRCSVTQRSLIQAPGRHFGQIVSTAATLTQRRLRRTPAAKCS